MDGKKLTPKHIYIAMLLCELPSRVTLADFQTTKKLANPHKY